MKLGVFSVVDAFPAPLDEGRDRYSEVLQLAGTADEAGLDSFWVAEHHFHPGGLCPSPPVLLAAAGSRTRRIRLGVLVGVLPFHPAIEVAEQYALLDQLVSGRLNVGFGSGYILMEFEGFGVDPASKRDRFDRALSTILSAWNGEEVRADGGAGSPVRLNVLPRQRPHPPLWIAVQRREAVPHVARKGMGIALIPYATVTSLEELALEIREYRESLPPGVNGKVSVAVPVYGGPHPERGRQAIDRYLSSRLKTQSAFYAKKVAEDPRHADSGSLIEAGLVVVGDPSEARRRLARYAAIGVDELLGIFDFGGLAARDVEESVRGVADGWPGIA